jgi:3-oxoacyl-[acyl-carrier-protein] synthase-3
MISVDWLMPHQANIRILQATAKKLDMPMEKCVVTVAQHGNTSAASVPLALDRRCATAASARSDSL